MKEHYEHCERREVQDHTPLLNQRRMAAPPVTNRQAYDFSQIDFSQAEIQARLGRAYAILLKRAKQQIQERNPADYTDIRADAPKERRVANE